MTTPTPGRTARQVLVDWANGQDAWAKMLAADVLLTSQEASEETVRHAYEALLVEKNLRDGQALPSLQIEDRGSAEGGVEPLVLTRLSDVRNVNALAAGQVIDFNPKMTVLYGENAAGKTGYVRILKRAAAVRVAEAILPNVVGGAAGTPQAKIAFRTGAATTELDWKDELGVPPLNRISVFDARCVSLHVDDELTYVYTPRDLALFQFMHQALEAVRRLLDLAKAEAAPKGNAFVARFARGTTVFPRIEALGPTTDLTALKALGSLTDEELAELPRLKAQVEALQSDAVASRLQVARGERQLASAIVAVADVVGRFDADRYDRALVTLRDAQAAHEQATVTAFAGIDIPGGLTESWRRFIHAGEDYIKDSALDPYPGVDSKCAYCLQPLEIAAVELIRTYREYVTTESRRLLDAAQVELQAASRANGDARTMAVREQIDSRIAAGDGSELLPLALGLVDAVDTLNASIRAGAPVDVLPLKPQIQRVALLAASVVAEADSTISALTAQADERARVLAAIGRTTGRRSPEFSNTTSPAKAGLLRIDREEETVRSCRKKERHTSMMDGVPFCYLSGLGGRFR